MSTEKPADDLARQMAAAVLAGDQATAQQIRAQLPRRLRRKITIRRIAQQKPDSPR
jgi:hypothetical protein